MNFLIYDDELVSEHFIQELINDFSHVKLFTTNQSACQRFSPSKFLTINQGNISNAVDVLKTFSQHENDPFDGILLFNLLYSTSLNNVLQTLQRLTRQAPRIFLIFINQQKSIDENLIKILQDSFQTNSWTIIFCNKIDHATDSTTNYQIKFECQTTNNQSISSIQFLDFLQTEFKSNKYLNKIIYLY